MVEVPDRLLAQHVITIAREGCDYGDVVDTAAEGKYGQHTYDTDWSIADMDPEKCDVDLDGDTVVVHGVVEAEYSVQVRSARYNPPGKAHPAEYENRSMPLGVSISMEMGELPYPVVDAEPI